jgi:membrane-associated phospholipid phosphatase
VTAFVAAGRRVLPRGWIDLGRQLVIWFGFLFAYQIARGLADRNPAKAFTNGWRVIDFEQRTTHHIVELTLQRIADSSGFLSRLASFTYWTSEFAVVGLALLWVYLRRHDSFSRFRNSILLANIIGLIGYVLAPTAPPRMFTSLGFTDTLGSMQGLNHGSGLIQVAPNPYAAMPSLHAADALIVGLTLALLMRRWWTRALWLAWPLWVWFCVMATANHFWLDVLAGIGVALLALALVHRTTSRRLIAKLL